MISLENNGKEKIGQTNVPEFKNECLSVPDALKGNTRKQSEQVNSREPCVLLVPCLPVSFRVT